MPNVTFQYNGATITVREAKGRDAFEQPYLLYDLVNLVCEHQQISRDALPDLEWANVKIFIQLLQRSTIEGDLGFPFPHYPRITAEALYDAYAALMESPYALCEEWRQALRKSDLELPDPEE